MKAVGSLMVDGGDASGTCSEVDGGRQRMGTGFRMERTARRFFFSWMRQSVFPEERQLEQGRPTIRASHRTLRRWQWTQAAEPDLRLVTPLPVGERLFFCAVDDIATASRQIQGP